MVLMRWEQWHRALFASLLVGTILSTLGQQLHIEVLQTIGGFGNSVSGCAMAIAIGYALKCPPLVLFSLAAVGYSANALGGAGGPLSVLVIAIIAAELGKVVSKETKIDILVTPCVTILVGCGLSMLIAPAIGAAASALGEVIRWGNNSAAFLDGDSDFGTGRYCIDTADLVGGYLCKSEFDRTGGRKRLSPAAVPRWSDLR